MSQPFFKVFTGPMFGSKTTRMMSVIERARYQNKNVVVFKPKMDDRYARGEIVTHNGMRCTAYNVETDLEILEIIKDRDYDLIAVDEAFMIDGVGRTLVDLFRQGMSIVVSSIQLSAAGNVFEEMQDMLPWATHIEVCPAVCPITGEDAYYTVRKVSSTKEIEVGGSELYEPRSWSAAPFMNKNS